MIPNIQEHQKRAQNLHKKHFKVSHWTWPTLIFWKKLPAVYILIILHTVTSSMSYQYEPQQSIISSSVFLICIRQEGDFGAIWKRSRPLTQYLTLIFIKQPEKYQNLLNVTVSQGEVKSSGCHHPAQCWHNDCLLWLVQASSVSSEPPPIGQAAAWTTNMCGFPVLNLIPTCMFVFLFLNFLEV